MKKIITLIILITAVAGQVWAFGMAGLQLRHSANLPMNIYVNGHLVAQNNPHAIMHQLPAGQQWIQIDQLSRSAGFGGAAYRTIFAGNITLPAHTMTAAVVYLNQLVIESQFAMQTQPVQYIPPVYTPVNMHPAYGWGWENHYGHHYGNGWQQGGHFGGHFQQQYAVMSHELFARLKIAIRNQPFSSGQRQVAEQALTANFLTSQQVFELVNLFTFNNDKLAIAKRAYHSTVDPENYFVVFDALDFNSSVNELAGYIASL
jgi:hypothetical protein